MDHVDSVLGLRPRGSRRGGCQGTMGALSLIILVLAACVPSPPMRERTVTLRPIDEIVRYQHEIDRWDGRFGFCSFADRKPIEDADELLVGFDYWLDPAEPFGCSEVNNIYYRSGFVFDVEPIRRLPRKVVLRATLTWTDEWSQRRTWNNWVLPMREGPNTQSCITEVLESAGSIFNDAEFLPGRFVRSGPGDVTGVVQAWTMRGERNWGFVLKSQEPSLLGRAACLSGHSNPTLKIVYLAP